MSVHSNGDGIAWNTTLDKDQPHGLDYIEWQDIRIGISSRLGEEHGAFADDTVGGIHKPGESAVLGMADGTPANNVMRGHALCWDGSARLWCNTNVAGSSVIYSPCLMTIHPDKQWGGGDVTWTGVHSFAQDASIAGAMFLGASSDYSGPINISGNLEVTGFPAIRGYG